MADPLAALHRGSRVVVRHRLEAPDPVTGAHLTDVVGDLLAVDAEAVTVLTAGGAVRVPRATVVAAKVVPPRPSRRGAPHRAVAVADLQRVMVDAWPPMERERLGQWVLCASRGFTGRGNSAVTVGDPGLPLAAAVDRVEEWYAVRRLPPNLTVAGPVGRDLREDPLGAELLGRGYAARVATLTLTASTRAVLAALGPVAAAPGAAPPGTPPVRVGDALTEAWLTAYRSYREADDVAARAILTGSPEQWFATVEDDGTTVAVGRLAVAHAWGGVAAMWVAPAHRRRGLARAVLGALAARADVSGARSLHLQADADHTAALALHRSCGFRDHHAYTNVVRPP
ncbi:MAG TPA: GNAT family N-acetyltransferase [Dermatophilaceae bacterium]|nr:GNAT family N-acetyltransferase [Dermatophilaceae bacterium]